jgi:stage II sporulation protein R
LNSVKTDENEACGEYLRIHIRADSNEAAAQSIKYCVRDRVVEYLTPIVAECPTKAAAMQGVESRLAGIAEAATTVLKEKGFTYTATAELTRESFPTRVYGEYTLPAGEYSALIIRLGSGEGDNWWCVVYPPLCFASAGENVVYKSKIAEIIQDFKNRS